MKYAPRQYAQALLTALDGKSAAEEKRLFRRFLSLLLKNGDKAKLSRIVHETERLYLKKAGLKKVRVESASPLSQKVKREIEEILGKKILLQEKINPGLLAGIKILVNDEMLIDASAATRIHKLFQK